MIIKTTPGKTYVVESDNGCTVKRQEASTAALTVEAGAQGYFVATAQEYEVSDDAARVVQVFKLAPQQRLTLLGVLGGNVGAGALPEGWTRVEYLESSGNQFIAANYVLDSECEISVDFQPTGNNTPQVVFAWDNVRARCIGLVRNSTYLNYDWSQTRTGDNPHNLERHNVVINSKGAWLDGGQACAFPVYAPFVTDSAFHVFKGSGSFSYRFIGRIYALQVKKAGKVVFDMVPCLKDTGAPCYYDLISKKAFSNQMTGDFTYPTTSTTYALRRVLPDWGKLSEYGLSRLYHAPADWDGELIDYALENGYKQIVEPEMPEQGYWVPQWRETEDEIILEWVETEAPEDEFLTIPTEQ